MTPLTSSSADQHGGIGSTIVRIACGNGHVIIVSAYAVGSISGGHFNPAVTLGLYAAGRHPAHEVGPYIIAQLIGATVAATALAVIFKAQHGELGGFAANGWRPGTIGAASRLAGVTPAAVSLLLVHVKKHRQQAIAATASAGSVV